MIFMHAQTGQLIWIEAYDASAIEEEVFVHTDYTSHCYKGGVYIYFTEKWYPIEILKNCEFIGLL